MARFRTGIATLSLSTGFHGVHGDNLASTLQLINKNTNSALREEQLPEFTKHNTDLSITDKPYSHDL
jgi:hypothetical protein